MPAVVSPVRVLLALGVAVVVVLIGGGSASAEEPEAYIVTGDGTVVASVADDRDAPNALELAVASRSGPGLRIEFVYESHGTQAFPVDDPLSEIQWNLTTLRMGRAWQSVDGEGVTVAVLDSPINFTGQDGLCGPVLHPYNALIDVPGLSPLNTIADFGHGTHVAGTVTQCTNNGIGVAGFAPGASLMPVQVLDETGAGVSSDLVAGIDWAVTHGADVINLSLGKECFGPYGPGCSDFLVDQAIDRAVAAGVLLVASSGNQANDHLAYPAAHPDVFSVGATDSFDLLWYEGTVTGSNGGPTLDVVAPGVDILQETTGQDGNYAYGSGVGTSMAAPHVTAAIALILEADPTLARIDVAHLLHSTAVDLGAQGYDPLFGHGRIDVGAMVDAAVPPCSATTTCDTVVSVDETGLWGLWSDLVGTPAELAYFFGNPGDVPFTGDWDGDGDGTPGLYRQEDGFVYLRNTNTEGFADLEFFFGNPGDVPLVGDFDGDGRDSVSIWRSAEGRVYVVNELGEDGAGLGAADYSYGFGNPGDTPFVGDFDGDGIDTVGLYRESTGFVYFRNSNSTGVADLEFFYGDPGDRILAGDWDGDGDDTVAVYRPSTGRLYVNLENAARPADWSRHVGDVAHLVAAGRL